MFLGYAGRTQSKITWPLVFVHVAPEEWAGGYLQRSVQLDLENEFTSHKQNVRFIDFLSHVGLLTCLSQLLNANITLKVAGNRAATSSLRHVVEFHRQAGVAGSPANTLVVLQTTSSLTTGALFYGNDKNRKKPAYSTLPDLVTSFLGDDMMTAMSQSNAKALATPKCNETKYFFEHSAFSRGGWRGLILVTQGPTIRNPPRLNEAIGLVRR